MVNQGRHRREPGTAAETIDETGEYFSKDVDYDWLFEERYEPRYPLTRAEEKLLELNQTGQTSYPEPKEKRNDAQPGTA